MTPQAVSSTVSGTDQALDPGSGPKHAFIIGPPTGFQAASGRYLSSLRQLSEDPALEIIGSLNDDGEKLALMTDGDVRRVKCWLPSVVIEPNILYTQWRPPLVEDFEPIVLRASTSGNTVNIRVSSDTGPVEGVTVYLIARVEPGRKSGY
jgi:hypothetical protein